MPAAPEVGLVGLGAMGLALAGNLLADGHPVVGCRRTPAPLQPFVDAGGKTAPSVEAVGERARLILLSLDSPGALAEVVRRLLPSLTPASTVVEMSTLPLADKENAREALAAAGVAMLDAPVSGTPQMVARRHAVVLASGEDRVIEAAAAVLGSCGLVRQVGAFGDGTRLKYVLNLLVAVHVAAAAEAVALGERLGLDGATVLEAVSGSPAGSAAFEFRAARMVAGEFLPAQGTVGGLCKDAELIVDSAQRVGAATPMLSAARRLYESALRSGAGDRDVSAVVAVLRG